MGEWGFWVESVDAIRATQESYHVATPSSCPVLSTSREYVTSIMTFFHSSGRHTAKKSWEPLTSSFSRPALSSRTQRRRDWRVAACGSKSNLPPIHQIGTTCMNEDCELVAAW